MTSLEDGLVGRMTLAIGRRPVEQVAGRALRCARVVADVPVLRVDTRSDAQEPALPAEDLLATVESALPALAEPLVGTLVNVRQAESSAEGPGSG
jgi:hypothetical protein